MPRKTSTENNEMDGDSVHYAPFLGAQGPALCYMVGRIVAVPGDSGYASPEEVRWYAYVGRSYPGFCDSCSGAV